MPLHLVFAVEAAGLGVKDFDEVGKQASDQHGHILAGEAGGSLSILNRLRSPR